MMDYRTRKRGEAMLIRMLVGLAAGLSKEEIIADEMARLTPVAAEAAETPAGEDDGETRRPAEHDG